MAARDDFCRSYHGKMTFQQSDTGTIKGEGPLLPNVVQRQIRLGCLMFDLAVQTTTESLLEPAYNNNTVLAVLRQLREEGLLVASEEQLPAIFQIEKEVQKQKHPTNLGRARALVTLLDEGGWLLKTNNLPALKIGGQSFDIKTQLEHYEKELRTYQSMMDNHTLNQTREQPPEHPCAGWMAKYPLLASEFTMVVPSVKTRESTFRKRFDQGTNKNLQKLIEVFEDPVNAWDELANQPIESLSDFNRMTMQIEHPSTLERLTSRLDLYGRKEIEANKHRTDCLYADYKLNAACLLDCKYIFALTEGLVANKIGVMGACAEVAFISKSMFRAKKRTDKIYETQRSLEGKNDRFQAVHPIRMQVIFSDFRKHCDAFSTELASFAQRRNDLEHATPILQLQDRLAFFRMESGVSDEEAFQHMIARQPLPKKVEPGDLTEEARDRLLPKETMARKKEGKPQPILVEYGQESDITPDAQFRLRTEAAQVEMWHDMQQMQQALHVLGAARSNEEWRKLWLEKAIQMRSNAMRSLKNSDTEKWQDPDKVLPAEYIELVAHDLQSFKKGLESKYYGKFSEALQRYRAHQENPGIRLQ